MAKQKSGLGKGIGALFGESDVPYTQSSSTPSNEKSETSNETEIKKSPVPTNATDLYITNKSQSNSSSQKPSEIFISEDALESARVVERVAKKPSNVAYKPSNQKPSVKTQPLKTAPIKPASMFTQNNSGSVSGTTFDINTTYKNESTSAKPQIATTEAQAKEAAKKIQSVKAAKPVQKNEKGTIVEVALSDIEPNPDQPRTNFKKEEIDELASSIKQEGLLQPILVRKVENKYQIIAGERRYQACKSLNMETVPVRLWLADKDKALELALIENIQRSDLNPIEEAYGYKRLMERKGMTQSEVAKTVSKGRSTIANALRLLDLPEEAQQLLFEEKITAGHARAILSIPTEEGKKKLTNKLLEKKLSVREAEALANLIKGNDKAQESNKKRTPLPESYKLAAHSLTRYLSVPVRIKNAKGKNKIEISFKDEEELKRILDIINNES